MLVIILLNVLAFAIYYFAIKPFKYWESKKITHEKGLPIFGNMLPLVLRTGTNVDVFQRIYNKHPNERYIGMYNFTTPVLLLTDPELIKKVMVKEFETFPEHRPLLSSDVDPLWSKNLFAMEGGENWHDLRSTLSPAFTSSKMKAMFVLVKACSKQYSQYYQQQGDVIDVELKDSFARFANDVIATTAFGVTCDSLSNPKSEFYLMGKELMNFTGIRGLLFLINFFSPSLAKIIRTPIFSKQVRKFFTTLVIDSIKLREEKQIIRPDMLHLLIEARKGQLKHEATNNVPDAGFAVAEESQLGKTVKKHKMEITDEIITAQVLIFFFAGFDTVSTMMSYAVYELALNPNIQDTLRKEVEKALKQSDGDLTYDSLMGMKYLDMVVSETLRKYPPLILIDRRSVRPYTLEAERPGETPLYLEKRTPVICPVFSIHRDPKYYPNPDKFDPERFNEENRSNINPYTYLPFGVGPRNCIGSRFALLEGKLVIAEIIKNFEVVPIAKTQNPIIFSKKNFNPLPDNGIWVGFKRRPLN